MQGRYSRARQTNRAKREQRRLRLYLGRVIRDIKRKCKALGALLATMLELAKRIFNQKRNDTNKLYALHAPEVECIGKGKARKKYEFGCEVSIVTSSEDPWVLAVQAMHGNSYDGHTLKQSLDQAEQISGWRPEHAYCDKGYKGVWQMLAGTRVHLANQKKA